MLHAVSEELTGKCVPAPLGHSEEYRVGWLAATVYINNNVLPTVGALWPESGYIKTQNEYVEGTGYHSPKEKTGVYAEPDAMTVLRDVMGGRATHDGAELNHVMIEVNAEIAHQAKRLVENAANV